MGDEPKNVGMVFDLLVDKNPDAREALMRIAKMSTYAENALWLQWRLHDPVSAADFRAAQQLREAGEKFKLPNYKLQEAAGMSPDLFCKKLCPGLTSRVYDSVANHVSRLYRQKRWAYLSFWERLPMCKDLRIRFRGEGIEFRPHPENPQWVQVGLAFEKDADGKCPRLWLDVRPRGRNPLASRWLQEVIAGTRATTGGEIVRRRRGGRWCWQMQQAREAYPGEHEQVDPIPGRVLVCYAPLNQEEFLYCQVSPVNGRPWRIAIEGHDFVLTKLRDRERDRRMGRNYHQSPLNSAHGHGRDRAIQGKRGGRYENRSRTWIENRSLAVVQFALETRCEKIECEDLTKRDPARLLLGSFDYSRFLTRIEQKAARAGIGFSKFASLEKALAALKTAGDGSSVTTGG